MNTDNPQDLLNSIYEKIDAGTIETWTYDQDDDFSHTTSNGQWEGQAWLHPTVASDMLILNIIPPDGGVSSEAYAVYHGRFIEMLLAHFDGDFIDALATAQPTNGDRVK